MFPATLNTPHRISLRFLDFSRRQLINVEIPNRDSGAAAVTLLCNDFEIAVFVEVEGLIGIDFPCAEGGKLLAVGTEENQAAPQIAGDHEDPKAFANVYLAGKIETE